MQLDKVSSLARRLMDDYGLSDWEFGFDRAKRRLGACWLLRRRITLSRHFAELNSEYLVRDVILHEIAHALTPGDGHGAEFKQKAQELGCNEASCVEGSLVVPAPARLILQCPHCGNTWPRYRRPSRQLACRSCLRKLHDRTRPLVVRWEPG